MYKTFVATVDLLSQSIKEKCWKALRCVEVYPAVRQRVMFWRISDVENCFSNNLTKNDL